MSSQSIEDSNNIAICLSEPLDTNVYKALTYDQESWIKGFVLLPDTDKESRLAACLKLYLKSDVGSHKHGIPTAESFYKTIAAHFEELQLSNKIHSIHSDQLDLIITGLKDKLKGSQEIPKIIELIDLAEKKHEETDFGKLCDQIKDRIKMQSSSSHDAIKECMVALFERISESHPDAKMKMASARARSSQHSIDKKHKEFEDAYYAEIKFIDKLCGELIRYYPDQVAAVCSDGQHVLSIMELKSLKDFSRKLGRAGH